MFDFLATPPWWFIVAVSLVCGALLRPLRRLSMGVFYRMVRNSDPIVKIWHSYFFSYSDNNSVLRHYKWSIKKGWRTEYVINHKAIGEPPLEYVGTMKLEKNFLLVESKCKTNQEHVTHIIQYPIVHDSAKLVGVKLSQDFHGRPMAVAEVFSQKELAEDEVMMELNRRINIDTVKKTMLIIDK